MKKLILGCLLLFFVACESKLPVIGEFPDTVLVTQDGKEFTFSDVRGKVVVVSYIYTNCPDICHMISARMNVLKEKLKQANLQDKVYLVSISLDLS